MTLQVGVRLGPYEVTGTLGAGGMGEVYRARDTRLKRNVALKILPTTFADDPDRLARFQGEAEVLASLNHPNIAALYGLEDAGNTKALIMELVEGPTLAERIAQGPIRRRGRDSDRQADRRGARGRARAGHHPPRPEARQREGAGRRHGEGAGLRSGEGAGAGRRRTNGVAVSDGDVAPEDAGRIGARHSWIHVPGTGAWKACRQAHRHLGLRVRALRTARRTGGV